MPLDSLHSSTPAQFGGTIPQTWRYRRSHLEVLHHDAHVMVVIQHLDPGPQPLAGVQRLHSRAEAARSSAAWAASTGTAPHAPHPAAPCPVPIPATLPCNAVAAVQHKSTGGSSRRVLLCRLTMRSARAMGLRSLPPAARCSAAAGVPATTGSTRRLPCLPYAGLAGAPRGRTAWPPKVPAAWGGKSPPSCWAAGAAGRQFGRARGRRSRRGRRRRGGRPCGSHDRPRSMSSGRPKPRPLEA